MSAAGLAPICCAKCHQPVKVVCDAHGTDCVLELSPDAVPLSIRKAGAIPAPLQLRPGTTRAAIAALFDDMPDGADPYNTDFVAQQIGIAKSYAAFELAYLTDRHRIKRVMRGLYTKAGR